MSRQTSGLAFLLVLGAASGLALALDILSDTTGAIAAFEVVSICLVAAAGCSIIFVAADNVIRSVVRRLPLPKAVQTQHRNLSRYTFLIYSFFWLGATGLVFNVGQISLVILLWIFAQIMLIVLLIEGESHKDSPKSQRWITFLFAVSGFAALIYQIVWQRVLFAAFGINIESMTLIVSIFMFGLGIGSVVGGQLSKRYPAKLALMFVICESLIGVFGLVSLPVINLVAAVTVTGAAALTGIAIYGLLSVPTLLMGATLPILVAFLHDHIGHVGKSVSTLYWVNTIGSAVACFVIANVLFVLGGQQSSVWVAATLNITIAIIIFTKFLRIRS